MAVKNIKKEEFRELIKTGNAEIIDVREKQEYDIVHVKNSKLIPMGELSSRINEIDWEKQVIFLCRTGARSRMMADAIITTGRDINNLEDGIADCFYNEGEENLIIDKNNINKYF